ncbi:bifunctional RNase H/acid phosphatase [Streptomyces cinereoruber]|uniref:bifunctional RNase H/acid phosphatase n=1 Tax=Streptomyces cinereoruber TaxID=67260 RepID=UPI003C2DD0D5
MTSARELVVEADGGSRGNPGPAGYGAVVLDAATGETLAEAAEYIGVATNNVAEYKGLVAGLKAARELFPDATVHVRMDSKLVVEQMSGRWKIKHPDMKPLAAEASRVFPAGRVRYEWIPRERNKHADRLANEAMDAGRLGRRWEPSGSTAPLDASAARNAAAPPPSGPPGDARAGAARARAALSGTAWTPSTGTSAGIAGTPSTGTSAGIAGTPTAGTSAGASGTPSIGTPAGTSTAGTSGSPAAKTSDARTGTGAGARPATDDGPNDGPNDGLFAAEDVTATSSTPVASGDFEAEAGALAPTGHAARTTGATRADAPASTPVQPRGTAPQGWAGPDMGAPATFVLLRHGETALTPEKRFSGSGGSDPELSAAGLRQAEAVAAALAARGTIQEIVSSPLTRCRQTAAAVAARLGLDVRIEQGLRETDFGAWEGLTFGEVRERYPEDLDAWLASPKAAPTGGGESFATVARRVAATRDRLTAAHAGRTVLLVTHVTPIKTLVRLALGAPPESLFRMELSAASISAVAYYADGNASVRLLNDTSHLR